MGNVRKAAITHVLLAIALTPVKSSQIHAIGHDPATNTLAVQFINKDQKVGPGDIYYYQNVTADLYQEFVNAPSLGTYHGKTLRGNPDQFPCTKYVPDESTLAA